MTFEEELKELLEQHRAKPFEEQEAAVKALHLKHGREMPPPITGTINIHEPHDAFKRK